MRNFLEEEILISFDVKMKEETIIKEKAMAIEIAKRNATYAVFIEKK